MLLFVLAVREAGVVVVVGVALALMVGMSGCSGSESSHEEESKESEGCKRAIARATTRKGAKKVGAVGKKTEIL